MTAVHVQPTNLYLCTYYTAHHSYTVCTIFYCCYISSCIQTLHSCILDLPLKFLFFLPSNLWFLVLLIMHAMLIIACCAVVILYKPYISLAFQHTLIFGYICTYLLYRNPISLIDLSFTTHYFVNHNYGFCITIYSVLVFITSIVLTHSLTIVQ